MSENIRIYNPKGASIIVDLVGHSLGGHSEVRVTPDRRTHTLISTGALLELPEPKRATPEPAPEPEPAPATPKQRKRTTTADNGAESGE